MRKNGVGGVALLVVLFFTILVPGISLAAATLYVDDSGNVGIGNSTPQSKLDISGSAYSRLVNVTDAASVAIDWNSSNVQDLILDRSTTDLSFTNGQAGGAYKLIIEQDSTGGRVVTWPSSIEWLNGGAPTLLTAASSTNVVNFTYNGNRYLGSYLTTASSSSATRTPSLTTATSSFAWTKPAQFSYVTVEIWGGGGGGAGNISGNGSSGGDTNFGGMATSTGGGGGTSPDGSVGGAGGTGKGCSLSLTGQGGGGGEGRFTSSATGAGLGGSAPRGGGGGYGEASNGTAGVGADFGGGGGGQGNANWGAGAGGGGGGYCQLILDNNASWFAATSTIWVQVGTGGSAGGGGAAGGPGGVVITVY